MADSKHEFIRFALDKQVLRFADFVTRAGRVSPYFLNFGMFDDGESLMKLGDFYAAAILGSGVRFDMLFGPAYKGIPLVASVSISLARQGRNTLYAFDRKEAKRHGEGGAIVGAALKGNVLIVDDVISAGVSVREAVKIIRAQGATPCGVVIAVDRQERGQGELSAVREAQRDHGIPVISIAELADLIHFLDNAPELKAHKLAMEQYRARYGV